MNAAGIWRGIFPGATRIASKRMSRIFCVRICRQPNFGGGGDPPALPLIHGFCGFINCGARFHLSKYQQLTPTRDNIDFAERASPSPRQNAESLGDQEGRGTAFGRNSHAKCGLPFWSRRGLLRPLRPVTLRHGRHSW